MSRGNISRFHGDKYIINSALSQFYAAHCWQRPTGLTIPLINFISMRFLQCRLVFAFLLIPSVLSVLINVTIDDTFADPLTGYHFDYSPATSWSIGANCDGCSALPDSSQVYDKTWHTGTFVSSQESISFAPSFCCRTITLSVMEHNPPFC